jgi:leucyl-tRNA synthetase
MISLAKSDEKIASILEGKQIIKEIAVPGKLVNIVAR